MLNIFISTFKTNWEEYLNSWSQNKNQSKIDHNYFKMKPLFNRIKQFLDKNDVYNSQNIVEVNFTISYEPQTFIKAIEKVWKIYEIIEDIGTQ